MYKLYLGETLFPVAPDKITTKISNKNKTLTMLQLGEINRIHPAGLTEVSFELLLPAVQYPFAVYADGFRRPNYYLDRLEALKIDGEPFQYIVARHLENSMEQYFGTNMTVTLEDYTITEAAAQGCDIQVSVKLKQYRAYATKTLPVTVLSDGGDGAPKAAASAAGPVRPVSGKIPSTYTVVSGDTLWGIAKKLLGDGAKCWNLAKLNNLSNPNLIRPGQVLKIEDVPASAQSTSITRKVAETKNVQAAKSAAGQASGNRLQRHAEELNQRLGLSDIESLGKKHSAKTVDGLTGASGYAEEAPEPVRGGIGTMLGWKYEGLQRK